MDPVEAAQMLCDKHMKMVVESAQMLSTVHRVLDGDLGTRTSKSGKRMKKHWYHPILQDVLYDNVHEKHPSTVWTSESLSNYIWHYNHFIALCDEYTYRYGRTHACDTRFRNVFSTPPKNIPNIGLTTPRLAMESEPECKALGDPILAYRAFYQTKQTRFKMLWKNREIPDWFNVKESICF